MTTKKPSVVTGVADKHARPGERIVEVSFPNGLGGLISLSQDADGQCKVELYRFDPAVTITVPSPAAASAPDTCDRCGAWPHGEGSCG